jgi:hypothetical protein
MKAEKIKARLEAGEFRLYPGRQAFGGGGQAIGVYVS